MCCFLYIGLYIYIYISIYLSISVSDLDLQGRLEVPDKGHGAIINTGANLHPLFQRDRAVVCVVKLSIKPTGQEVKVGQCGTHPHNLNILRNVFFWRGSEI